MMTINKRYSINHVDAYTEYNGDYILCRKREFYLREDETFILNTIYPKPKPMYIYRFRIL